MVQIIGDFHQQRNMVRKHNRARRSALSRAEVRELSARLVAKLELLPAVADAKVIMGFIPFENEVDILPFLKAHFDAGQTILLPRLNKEREIEAVGFHELCTWTQNSFGVFEPSGAAFPPEKIEAVIIPGLAYDPQGFRLGYGKGYYDRFLGRLDPRAFKCGVCYEFQVVDNIYPHGGDIPVHWIITDHSEIMLDQSFF